MGRSCGYCKGTRIVDDFSTGEQNITETDLEYPKIGLTSPKLKIEDLEKLMLAGFTRLGTYVYQRNPKNACCEVF